MSQMPYSRSAALIPLDPLFCGPHSGYHWRGDRTRFFEGWYFRITLPAIAQTFAFMYSIDDPSGGQPHSGGAAQILGPNEDYYCRSFPDVHKFWAWSHGLGFGHWRDGDSQPLPPDDFTHRVQEGYQVCGGHHQGQLLTPAGQVQARWNYEITPIAGWGEKTQQATAGWLSHLPVFEPGWQVLMAHGVASGSIEWAGHEYTFEGVSAYAEKNWGGAFPSKWFWIQCNAFANAPGLSVTAAGGMRDVLRWQEKVGLVGIHYEGQFYEFVSTKTRLTWTVSPWGQWRVQAQNYQYRVQIEGDAPDEGAWVRVPTLEGLQWRCRDTTHGKLRVQLWATNGELLIDAVSELAGLEVGGGPWDELWQKA